MAVPNELEKLQNYYETILAHARWSFWASLISVIVGLVVLLIGVVMIYMNDISTSGLVVTVSGVISEFISATLFYLYNKNMKQLNFFYEKLIKFQDTYWAMGLANGLPEAEKIEMMKLLIMKLATRNEPQTEMTPELVRAYGESMERSRRQT